MWPLFRKKITIPTGLSGLRCDMHSHLIPGIDDGSPDLETSVRLIRGLMDLGYRKIITTPHVNADIFRNTPAIIRAGLAELTGELARQGIDIEIELSAAAEYLMDDHFVEMLDNDEPLLTLQDNGWCWSSSPLPSLP
jgi:protein-tyrosine phosphatase